MPLSRRIADIRGGNRRVANDIVIQGVGNPHNGAPVETAGTRLSVARRDTHRDGRLNDIETTEA